MEITEKQRAMEALRALPEDATIDDAIERLCFITKIEEGRRPIGRTRARGSRRGQETVPVVKVALAEAGARADLAAIREFISQDSPHYAKLLD